MYVYRGNSNKLLGSHYTDIDRWLSGSRRTSYKYIRIFVEDVLRTSYYTYAHNIIILKFCKRQ